MADLGVNREQSVVWRAPGADGYAWRCALFYAALFLIYGVQMPYLPVWLDSRGLTAAEISIISATPFFLRIGVTPAVSLFADRIGNHRIVVIATALLALSGALLLSQAQGFLPILLLAIVMLISASTAMPLTETVTVEGVRREGLDYGRIRLWGSLTFIAASFGGGVVIDRFGAGAGIWMLVAGCAITSAAALLLPRPARAVPDASHVTGPSAFEQAKRLVSTPLFLVFLVAVGATQASHATLYTFGALHWRSQGISPTWVGILWAISVSAEILLFAYSSALARRFGIIEVLLAGALGCVVRWTILAFDPPLALLIPLQVLHALTYGATHIGAILFISRAVPAGASGTAQGLYATIAAGVGHGAATLASGKLYPLFGGKAFLAMAALSAVGLVASVVVWRRWDGGALWGREAGEVGN